MRPPDLPGGDGRERQGPRTVALRSRSPVGDMSGKRPKQGRSRDRSSSSEGERRKDSTKRGKGVGGDMGRREEETLERETVDTLRDENERLREELRRLRRSGTSTGSRSEVTPQPPSDPPPKTPERTGCEPAWIGQIPKMAGITWCV